MPAKLDGFLKFSATARIPSRDAGIIPFVPYQTQQYLFEEMFRAVEEDQRHIVLVKARQLGITQGLGLFDAYWLMRHPGLQGAFVADSTDNKEFFRDTMGEVLKGLPPAYRYPVRVHNRGFLAMGPPCHSRLAYHVAGSKVNKVLGQSRGIAFLHATEVSSWGDPEGITSLRSSISQRHPARLMIWESTAKGYNHFWDMWQDAQRAVTHRAIFIGWWRHELYEEPEDSKIYQTYWDGQLTTEEAAWQREITRRYQVTIRPTQWAWYRGMLAEGPAAGDMVLHHQNFPSLPEHAFQATGQSFLGAGVMARLRHALQDVPPAEGYRYVMSGAIEDVRLVQTTDAMSQLLIWEPPLPKDGHYVISADPAFGSSDRSDWSIAQVWRAARGQLIQVAEFGSNETSMTQFAWVICHLCGTYATPYLILEINGPGAGVMEEIHRMQRWGWASSRRADLMNAVGGIMHYLYRRPDSLRNQMAYHFKTSGETKPRIMDRLRDQIFLNHVQVRSAALVEELGVVRRTGNQYEAQGHAHDDRVIAAALAVECWAAYVEPIVQSMPLRAPGDEPARPEESAAPPAHERLMQSFFERLQAPGTGVGSR